MTVPRATIPTLEEMALPPEARLASLWVRNAGGVRERFGSFEDFSRRFGGSENPVAEAAVSD